MTDDYRAGRRPTYEQQRAERARQQAAYEQARAQAQSPSPVSASGRTRISSTLRDYERPLTHAPQAVREQAARQDDAAYASAGRATTYRGSASRADRTAGRSSATHTAASRASSGSRRPTRDSSSERSRYSRNSYGSQRGTRSAYSRDGYGSGRSSDRSGRTTDGNASAKKPFPIVKAAIVVALLAIVAFGVHLCSIVSPINITVNGTALALRGDKTVQTAASECGLPLNPGDLISLTGTVLKKKEGEPFSAVVNGEKVTDYSMKLKEGDKVELKDGEDIIEPYDAVQEIIPHSASILGVGSIHVFTSAGSDGIRETRTGRLSGDVVEKVTKEPEDLVFQRYNIDPPNDKVIALTFDDGPHKDYTKEILDILDEYNVKATFFIVGENVEIDNNDALLRRAYAAGHQLCTHTYDHARPVGSLNICLMSPEEQIDEIVHGRQVISDAIGTECSRVVRLPGGSIDEDTMTNIQPYIDAEIGWNIDTSDWAYPGADVIAEALMYAERGDVILCHDGGGDRTETIEALRIALPKLIEQGFRFVTIDELMTYPAYHAG